MDLARPLRTITPTVDADVLTVLARGKVSMTGREVQRATGTRSQDGVRRSLERLSRTGIVTRTRAGRSHLFALNTDHLLAPSIIAIVHARLELIDRLRHRVTSWPVQPKLAALFGSVATNSATNESDIDVLIVRPHSVDPDDPAWTTQLANLREDLWSWTGNDPRIVELPASTLTPPIELDVLHDLARDGIELSGSLAGLRKSARAS